MEEAPVAEMGAMVEAAVAEDMAAEGQEMAGVVPVEIAAILPLTKSSRR